jgi:ATP-dependent DNA helicase RecG
VTEVLEKQIETVSDFGKDFGKDFGITEPQLNILRLLAANPNAVAQTAADALGMTRRNVENHISRLKKIGLLEREGGRKNGRWIVRQPE